MTSPNRHRRPRERSPWLRPRVAAIAAVVLAAAGGVIAAVTLTSHTASAGSSPPPATRSSSVTSHPSPSSSSCNEALVVPAYFYSGGIWAQATTSKHPPRYLILNVASGPGNGPEQHFVTLVDNARAAGITVLGYVSTVDGQQPLNEVESQLYDYKAWYGVTSIFFDLVSGQPQDLAYYTTIANIVHSQTKGAVVWFNPGDYPDQRYMPIADVVMVFEGTYQQYLTARIPGWVSKFPASKFAHTIYDATSGDLGNALRLAAQRHAKYVYITDGTGANPYAELPSYWSQEGASAARCGAG